jgi:hypothetical protein
MLKTDIAKVGSEELSIAQNLEDAPMYFTEKLLAFGVGNIDKCSSAP